MSSEDYSRLISDAKKLIHALSQDMKHRETQEQRNETTYAVDSEIRGSLKQLDEIISRAQIIFNNFKAKPQDYDLSNKEIEKRSRMLEELVDSRANANRQYDAYFEKKPNQEPIKPEAPKPQLTKQELHQEKKTYEENQEALLDEMIGVVKNVKKGNQEIHKELVEQDVILDVLDKEMDSNMQQMGKVRRNMNKLLEQSSYCCLIIIIILEVIGLFCTGFAWHPK